ncbi:5-formyltetrahydrofolate cyclo-ligase [Aquipuribacter sp. MA13-6]|uniref:5-formyltetrahydrofolate cyclo-ligase n=1 Tax=unclassified Aquipuribacter TaxID=2635084 RepID=UPI003EEB83CA
MHPGPGSAKQVTRRRVRLDRAARGVGAAGRAAAALGDRVPELVALVADGSAGSGLTVAAYVSWTREPGTGPLRLRLAQLGHRVLLPWLEDDLDLDWVVDDLAGPADPTDPALPDLALPGLTPPDPMRPEGVRLGRGAVADVDLVLVPALAVDGAGTRLGQGGGSYDRALARLRPWVPPPAGAPGNGRPLVLAVVHEEELLPAGELPREPHDVTVDGALTPSGVRWLGARLSRPPAAPAAPGPPPPPPRA